MPCEVCGLQPWVGHCKLCFYLLCPKICEAENCDHNRMFYLGEAQEKPTKPLDLSNDNGHIQAQRIWP